MPKFFIGCPIKKARGTTGIGVTGRLHSFTASGTSKNDKYTAQAVLDTGVNLTSVLGGENIPAGVPVDIYLEQWEPIIPDGMKPIEQSELLCLPDGSFNPDGVLTPFKEEIAA